MAPQLGVGLPKIDKIRIKPKEKDKITPGCIIFGRLVIQSTYNGCAFDAVLIMGNAGTDTAPMLMLEKNWENFLPKAG